MKAGRREELSRIKETVWWWEYMVPIFTADRMERRGTKVPNGFDRGFEAGIKFCCQSMRRDHLAPLEPARSRVRLVVNNDDQAPKRPRPSETNASESGEEML